MDEKLKVDTLEPTEEKEDISHLVNRMFDENVVCEEEKPVGREYFDAVHHGQLKPNTDQIVLTRSMYNKSVMKIEENTKQEIREAKKYVPLYIIGIGLILFGVLAFTTACGLTGLEPLIRLAGGVWAGAVVALPTISIFLAVSTIKKIKRAKRAREKALQRLEDDKKECMILGTYDALK